jgi:hypothetical protein
VIPAAYNCKRVLCLGTGILLFLQVGVRQLEAEALMQEDFESGVSNFRASTSGAAKVEVSEENAAKGKRSLKFTDARDSKDPMQPSASFPLPKLEDGHYRLSFDYCFSGGDGPKFSVEIGGSVGNVRLFRVSFLETKEFVMRNGSGQGVAINNTITEGEWRNIVIDFSLPKQEPGFSVGIDGDITEGLPFWETDMAGQSIDILRFFDGGNEEDTVFVDNVIVEKLEK